MMPSAEAITCLSLACCYPDADRPEALWMNALDGRRAFRPMPRERLDLTRYCAEAVGEADSITPIQAALLADWEFDRAKFRIPADSFRVTDLTHWLALQVASEALANIGGVDRLDRTRTAVVVANTLAGEFSRAGLLRLRMPFLDDMLTDALAESGLADAARSRIRNSFADGLRARFPAPQEETLAGGLANTIAGRIANYFDLRAGAFSVDAACASSLVALAEAGNLLMTEQADAVLVGAVDLSLDPFELVGFSRNGALARDDMRVFDARAAGFWPGEGAGFTLLMRASMAAQRELRGLAILRGWGLSTDGAGGLTRPSCEGQLAACRRAYAMADVDPADVAFVEAHGTGTTVGDPIEVRALASLRQDARVPLPIGSIKGNIGHTKAAAGFAGLIKTIESLRRRVIAPHVGCEHPHPVFDEVDSRVRVVLRPEEVPAANPAIAGVSSFGFGGVNAHAVIEVPTSNRSPGPLRPIVTQDVELFLCSAETAGDLTGKLRRLLRRASCLSRAEMTDAAAAVCRVAGEGPWRAGIIARDAEELSQRVGRAVDLLEAGQAVVEPAAGVVATQVKRRVRIGFLFPGQAAPVRPAGGAWARRFPALETYVGAPNGPTGHPVDTRVAQPAIVASSLAALHVLRACGVEAVAALGHSLGEISALAWAGSLSDEAAVALAAARGELMSCHGEDGGGMLRLGISAAVAAHFALGSPLVVACENGPEETVVAGPLKAIEAMAEKALSAGVEFVRLPVSHAFHSPMMRGAVAPFAAALGQFTFTAPARMMLSSITGGVLSAHADICELLLRQLETPVRFSDALRALEQLCDLFIEVGPGVGLSRIARSAALEAVSVDAFGESLAPLFSVLALAFSRGAAVNAMPLFDDRAVRAIDLDTMPRFLASPCGGGKTPPQRGSPVLRHAHDASAVCHLEAKSCYAARPAEEQGDARRDALYVVLALVAETTGLKLGDLGPELRFLDDLHLNSLAVSRLVMAAARQRGTPVPRAPTEFANASIQELAEALEELKEHGSTCASPARIAGVRPWVRLYGFRWVLAVEQAAGSIRIDWTATHGVPEDLRQLLCQPTPMECDKGALVWLPERFDFESAAQLHRACIDACNTPDLRHLAISHRGAPITGFARTLAQEGYFSSVRVIERAGHVRYATIAAELSRDAAGYSEIRLEDDARYKPVFAPAELACGRGAPVGGNDVVLATGGARGIAAECALDLARRTGAALILCGRSPSGNAEVAATLVRAAAQGIRCRYLQADVCDAHALGRALAQRDVAAFGPVTILLHAPALNVPRRFTDIDEELFRQVLAPKVTGLANAVAAAGSALRRIISFGSIIGGIGLEGEAHYGLANAWQSAMTDAVCGQNVESLAIEWSVWGGVGMGERLGTLERLAASGVDALSVDDALAAFTRLVDANAVGRVVVTGRFGPPPHVDLALPSLPLLRHVDEPLLFFPGVEVISETTLSTGRDPYLAEHRLNGEAILPGVIGLEAMAQVASVLACSASVRGICNVAFVSAVTLPPDTEVCVRIAALRHEDGRVDAVLRASDDGFGAERMRATFLFGSREALGGVPAVGSGAACPADALYGPLFFGAGRFRRVQAFDALTARYAAFTLANGTADAWFGAFEPQELLLGDPGAHDAALHGLQVCVPHKRVLPSAVARITFGAGAAPARVIAVERGAARDVFTFDIFILDAGGRMVESWTGATFTALGALPPEAVLPLAPALAGPLIERMARQTLGDETLRVALVADPGLARNHRRAAALRDLPIASAPLRRGDGKPELAGPRAPHICLAHTPCSTLALVSEQRVGCDIAELAQFSGSEVAAIAWARGESLRKIGLSPERAHSAKVFAMILPIGAAAADQRTAVSVALTTDLAGNALAESPVHSRAGAEFAGSAIVAGASP